MSVSQRGERVEDLTGDRLGERADTSQQSGCLDLVVFTVAGYVTLDRSDRVMQCLQTMCR